VVEWITRSLDKTAHGMLNRITYFAVKSWVKVKNAAAVKSAVKNAAVKWLQSKVRQYIQKRYFIRVRCSTKTYEQRTNEILTYQVVT
jgi:hypothetical protein